MRRSSADLQGVVTTAWAVLAAASAQFPGLMSRVLLGHTSPYLEALVGVMVGIIMAFMAVESDLVTLDVETLTQWRPSIETPGVVHPVGAGLAARRVIRTAIKARAAPAALPG